MDQIVHKNLKVNGINMHVAELSQQVVPNKGAVLFLHGFPELWYSWRHQMVHLSAKGYRTIAPDLRGFGDTDAPPSVNSYTWLHIIGDLVALLDALELEKVFLVGHGWGAHIAWWFCLLRPDRIKAMVNTSIVFQPRNVHVKPVQSFSGTFGDDFYIYRFQEPGKAEAIFASIETATLFKVLLSSWSPKPPTISTEGLTSKSTEPQPSWLTDEDISYYATKFDKTGFTGGLNYYRAMDLSWELTAPWTGSQVKVPVRFITGDGDMMYNFPGMKEYYQTGMKQYVPLLDEVVVMEGVGHFLNQEKPEELSQHIYDYISKF